jgi:hypothetical protein
MPAFFVFVGGESSMAHLDPAVFKNRGTHACLSFTYHGLLSAKMTSRNRPAQRFYQYKDALAAFANARALSLSFIWRDLDVTQSSTYPIIYIKHHG